jgi:hypothetical protein
MLTPRDAFTVGAAVVIYWALFTVAFTLLTWSQP